MSSTLLDQLALMLTRNLQQQEDLITEADGLLAHQRLDANQMAQAIDLDLRIVNVKKARDAILTLIGIESSDIKIRS
jgi:hypothetical protein